MYNVQAPEHLAVGNNIFAAAEANNVARDFIHFSDRKQLLAFVSLISIKGACGIRDKIGLKKKIYTLDRRLIDTKRK